jgi:hypothetical protein
MAAHDELGRVPTALRVRVGEIMALSGTLRAE